VIRLSMTGFSEFKDLLREYISQLWPNSAFYTPIHR